MYKTNISHIFLLSSALAFFYPGSSHAMEDESDLTPSNLQVPSKNEEDKLSSLQTSKKSPFIELVQEKREIPEKTNELNKRLETLRRQGLSLVFAVMRLNDKSSSEFQEKQKLCLAMSKEEELIEEKMKSLSQRYQEIDKELPEAALALYRKREKKNVPTEGILYKNEELTSLAIVDLGKGQKVIQVPDSISNAAAHSFYIHHDSSKGLWFGMELLQPENISWWRERLGWEATMEFGKYFETEIPFKVSRLMSLSSNGSLESQIEQVFFYTPSLFDDYNHFGPQIHFEDEPELMSMRPSALGEAPLPFQRAYQSYTPSEMQRANYMAAFRGFKMNLDRYGIVPTWVAYVSSEKIEGPVYKTFEATSPAIKMAMTATVGGPLYSPLGIYSSPIARASDEKPCAQLSLPFHSFVARTMGDIDSNIKYVVTRPLENMHTIFRKSGLPFSSSFGNTAPTDNLPLILREGRYEIDNEKVVQFHNTRYTPFVLFDPQTGETYQMGKNHPFVTNYYLAGIPARGMKFPFITLDRKALADLYQSKQ